MPQLRACSLRGACAAAVRVARRTAIGGAVEACFFRRRQKRGDAHCELAR